MFQQPNRIIRISRDANQEISTHGPSDPLVTIAQDGKGGQIIQLGQQSPRSSQRRTEHVEADARVYLHLPGIAPSFHFLALCAGIAVVLLAVAAIIEHARPYFEFQPTSLNHLEITHHA